VTVVYIDTNVFIRAFESAAAANSPLEELFGGLKARPRAAVTSELTLAELLAPSKQKDAIQLEEKRTLYGDLLIWSGWIDLYPVTRTVLISTASLRQEFKCALPDAIHIVTAISSGCRLFLTDDERLARLPVPLRRLKSDAAGIEAAMEALHA
jgi:predicted nucleic acid-binding protein